MHTGQESIDVTAITLARMAASSAITPDSAAEADAPRPALGPTTMPTAGGGAAAHTGGAVSRAGADNTTRAGGSADSASAEPRARRSGYRRLPVQQRREQLIAVALELFSTRPPEEVGLDDVAEAAGASRPLVYRYFSGGKQQLYEAALRSAAEDLTNSFSLPAEGTPTEQLSSVLDRYFGFVAEHGTGYGALLRGGSVVETARTSAIVDEVRRVALRRTLRHLGVREAGPRLTLLVRSWISVVEASALSWLDEGRQIPKESLCAWLVDEFVAMSAATAVHDGQTAEVLAGLLALESADGPAAAMVVRLGRLRVGPPTARR